MTSTRTPAGVPTGGQFATSSRTEAALALTADGLVSAQAADVMREEVESLISRQTVSGGYQVAKRQDDVADVIRDHLVHLDDDAFEEHLARIAKAAENVSVIEHADETDTEAYQEQADEAGLELSDFPAGHDWAEGDGYHDLAAYRAAVIEHFDDQVTSALDDMIAADTAAAQHPLPLAATA